MRVPCRYCTGRSRSSGACDQCDNGTVVVTDFLVTDDWSVVKDHQGDTYCTHPSHLKSRDRHVLTPCRVHQPETWAKLGGERNARDY